MKIFVNVSIIFGIFLFQNCHAEKKYSAEENKSICHDSLAVSSVLRELDKPFRMVKLNLLWKKAKYRLPDFKLQSLFNELEIHDKEEIEFINHGHHIKYSYGPQVSKLRKKFIGIMSAYGLFEYFKDPKKPFLSNDSESLDDNSNHNSKNMFRYTDLNEIWDLVFNNYVGHSSSDSSTDRDEYIEIFHQIEDKVDEYMSLLRNVDNNDNENHDISVGEAMSLWENIEYQVETNNPIKNSFSSTCKIP